MAHLIEAPNKSVTFQCGCGHTRNVSPAEVNILRCERPAKGASDPGCKNRYVRKDLEIRKTVYLTGKKFVVYKDAADRVAKEKAAKEAEAKKAQEAKALAKAETKKKGK